MSKPFRWPVVNADRADGLEGVRFPRHLVELAEGFDVSKDVKQYGPLFAANVAVRILACVALAVLFGRLVALAVSSRYGATCALWSGDSWLPGLASFVPFAAPNRSVGFRRAR